MNEKEFISFLARMEGKPGDIEWAAIHKIAKALTVENVREIVDYDPRPFGVSENIDHAIKDSIIYGQSWYAPQHTPRQPQR